MAHWRSVESPRWLGDATGLELRVRSGLRRLSVFLLLDEGRLSLLVHQPESWFTWESPETLWYVMYVSQPSKDLGPLADLDPRSSSLFADICERLRSHGWTDGPEVRVAHQTVDKIATLVKEREQRLLALPPAAQIRWMALAREDEWHFIRCGALETTRGSLDMSLSYGWPPLTGSGPSANWGIHGTKAVGSPRPSSTGGRVPLGDVCCDQAVGDLEDWGWPRPESLGVGRALAEKALSDWRELEPERARRWQNDGL
jgi:hypothetical protein